MLLKIYTDRRTLVVIENIQDIEVHDETFTVLPHEWMNRHTSTTSLPSPASRFPIGETDYYDAGDGELILPEQVPHLHLKYIDYRQKDGFWKRVAIGMKGTTYLCNDQGKTIERILEPGRAAA